MKSRTCDHLFASANSILLLGVIGALVAAKWKQGALPASLFAPVPDPDAGQVPPDHPRIPLLKDVCSRLALHHYAFMAFGAALP